MINAQSDDEVMRRSPSRVGIRQLEIAFALHPDACAIKKTSLWKWYVECKQVPLHFYEDTTICDPGPSKVCNPPPPSYDNCRSFYWDVDLDGNTTDPLGLKKNYGSISEGCRPLATMASDRMEMARRGIAPVRLQIEDYAGSFTGFPRPIQVPSGMWLEFARRDLRAR